MSKGNFATQSINLASMRGAGSLSRKYNFCKQTTIELFV